MSVHARSATILTVGLGLFLGTTGVTGTDRAGAFISRLPAESAEDRDRRLELVRERREGIPLLVHRGAYFFAPENTLEAFLAAMERGADGVELDVRRSKDGILYLMHDATVDRVLKGEGKGCEMTHREISSLPFRKADPRIRVPTLAAFLELARRHAMLIHLDPKEPGLEEEIIELLDEGDLWEHVVHVTVNQYTKALRQHPRADLKRYKGWWHQAGETDEKRERFLAVDAEMVFVGGDPTEAARFLGKPMRDPMRIPDDLRVP